MNVEHEALQSHKIMGFMAKKINGIKTLSFHYAANLWEVKENFEKSYQWQAQSFYGRYLKYFAGAIEKNDDGIFHQTQQTSEQFLVRMLKEKKLSA